MQTHLHYRVHSTMVKSERWYGTRAEAIAAFEQKCKRARIAPPRQYPPRVSGDFVTSNSIAYPCRRSARGVREGHGWVYVDARSD